jgi:hypothetical protein
MPVLKLLQEQFPNANIVSDGGVSRQGTLFQSSNVKSYATANVRGIKYGAITNNRGKRCCYSYIQGRKAAQTSYLLSISIPRDDQLTIDLEVAIVRQFQAVSNFPIMPWSHL